MTNLRLLMVTETPATGCGRHIIDLCRYLADQGHFVSLVFPFSKASVPFLEQSAQFAFERFDLPMKHSVGLHDFATCVRVRQIIQKHGPYDIIHGHSSKGGAIARLSGINTGSKVVYTPHSFVSQNPELSRIKRLSYGTIEWILSYFGDAVITVAELENHHAATLKISGDKRFLILNEIDSLPCSDPHAIRRSVRSELGLKPEEIVFVSVGRLSQQKAYHRLVSAFAVVHQTAPETKLVIIGKGERYEDLLQQATALGIDKAIVFAGERVSAPMLPAFDVYVQCSTFESCSYSMLESLAAGLPMITTRVGSSDELIGNNEGGYVIPNGTSETIPALAHRMLELAGNSELRDSMGKRNQDHIKQQSIASMAGKTLDLYLRLLASRRAEDHSVPTLGSTASRDANPS